MQTESEQRESMGDSSEREQTLFNNKSVITLPLSFYQNGIT